MNVAVLAYVSALDQISELAHHRGARHADGVGDLLCGHRRAAQRADPDRARDMRDLGERRYAPVEMLTDDGAVDPLLCFGNDQDFLAPRDILELHWLPPLVRPAREVFWRN